MFVLFLHCAYCIYSDDCTLCNVCVNLQMHCVNAMLLLCVILPQVFIFLVSEPLHWRGRQANNNKFVCMCYVFVLL